MGCFFGQTWALWAGAVGPLVGFVSVLVARQKPDEWQLVVGVAQVAATGWSIFLLFSLHYQP